MRAPVATYTPGLTGLMFNIVASSEVSYHDDVFEESSSASDDCQPRSSPFSAFKRFLLDSTWPSPVPWEIPLSPNLNLEVRSYGHSAPQSWWTIIEENIDRMIDHLTRPLRPDGNIDFRSFQTQFVLFLFNDLADTPLQPRDAQLSRADASLALRTIKELYLDPEALPLELTANIKKRGQRPVSMQIRWLRDAQSRWPERADLPFFVRGPRTSLIIFTEMIWTGLVFDRIYDPLVEDALDSFIAQLRDEGDLNAVPRKGEYDHRFLRLYVDAPNPRVQVLVQVSVIIAALENIRELFFAPHDWAPKEITAGLVSERGTTAKVSLRLQ